MNPPDIAFMKFLVDAIHSNNQEKADAVLQRVLQTIGDDLIKVIEKYPTADLPLVLAAMKVLYSSFEGMLPDSGKFMANHIAESTAAIVFKQSEIERQLKREEDLQ